MFGRNELVGRKFFRDAGDDKVLVTSVFVTLQGEGPYSGRPAVFVRLAKCNLTCSFCDTFFDKGDWLTLQELRSKIYHTVCDYWNARNPSRAVPNWALPQGDRVLGPYGLGLVVTGGEPFLQSLILDFMEDEASTDNFAFVQVETNGTIDTLLHGDVTMVVSPKCFEKVDGKPTHYCRPSPAMMHRADVLKFVLTADDSSPYHTVPDWALDWAKKMGKPIYVSPMNVYNRLPQSAVINFSGSATLEERSKVDEVVSFWTPNLLNLSVNQANHEYAARYALDNGLFLSLQTHLYASLA